MQLSILGYKFRVEMLIAMVVISVISCMVMFHGSIHMRKEGMAPMNAEMGQGLTNNWMAKEEAMQKEHPDSAEAKLAHDVAPAPSSLLEAGQLDILADNRFSPDCCPQIYSSSSGCACMSEQQMNFLNQRGDNRTVTTNF